MKKKETPQEKKKPKTEIGVESLALTVKTPPDNENRGEQDGIVSIKPDGTCAFEDCGTFTRDELGRIEATSDLFKEFYKSIKTLLKGKVTTTIRFTTENGCTVSSLVGDEIVWTKLKDM